MCRYFHKELKSLLEGNIVHSIFREDDMVPKYVMKDHVTLHLYMSRAPCGDAAYLVPEEDMPLTSQDAELMEAGMHYPEYPDEECGLLSLKPEGGR